MKRPVKTFTCTECREITSKWFGQCPHCNAWNSLTEESVSPTSTIIKSTTTPGRAVPLATFKEKPSLTQRYLSSIIEWDRVTGGGIVPGAFILLSGDPGIGKSTLLLTLAHKLSQEHSVIYFSSEESHEQVSGRAHRLGCNSSSILFSDCANIQDIVATIHAHKPAIVILDSIQNCYVPDNGISSMHSISTIRTATFQLMRVAKDLGTSIIITGHITKEGAIAGPKTLEHMVDTVLYLSGSEQSNIRVLQAIKNRFGTTAEAGFFTMDSKGLQEVDDINNLILSDYSLQPGAALVSTAEGNRPLLVDVQALMVPTHFSVAQRVITGLDHKQVMLICAIIEKHLGIKCSTHDIFVKVGGGIKIKQSSADLGIAAALLSSFFQKTFQHNILWCGELTLTGQIKPVSYMPLQVTQAKRIGINEVVVGKKQQILSDAKVPVKELTHIKQLLDYFE